MRCLPVRNWLDPRMVEQPHLVGVRVAAAPPVFARGNSPDVLGTPSALKQIAGSAPFPERQIPESAFSPVVAGPATVLRGVFAGPIRVSLRRCFAQFEPPFARSSVTLARDRPRNALAARRTSSPPSNKRSASGVTASLPCGERSPAQARAAN